MGTSCNHSCGRIFRPQENRQSHWLRARARISLKRMTLGLATFVYTLLLLAAVPLIVLAQPDPSAPIRELLDRRFPEKELQTNPALAPGVLMFSAHELSKNLAALNIDSAKNAVLARLHNGKYAEWACEQQLKKLAASTASRYKYETHCSFSQTGMETAAFRVLIDRSANTTTVRAEIGSPGGEAIFVGTEIPADVPAWVPVVSSQYVETVRQAIYIPGVPNSTSVNGAMAMGRYVFDSNQSVESLIQHIDEVFTARGFRPAINHGPDAFSVMARGENGTLRFARFGTQKLPNGKSRVDLAFAQMPVSAMLGKR